MKYTSATRSPRQRGFTLVELMVALTIGLFLVGAVSTLFVNTRGSFDYASEIARIQETGRFALSTIARDVRMAGYNGCGSMTTTVNVINGGATNPLLDFQTPIHGYEASAAPASIQTPSGDRPITGTDVIILIGVDTSNELVVKAHNPMSAQIDTNIHSIKPGEILLITDCSKASLFQVTGPTNNNNNATNVVHNTGTGTPGNCYKTLGASCGAGSTVYTYKPGSSLLRVSSSAYFIANSSLGNGTRALWTMQLEGTTNGSSTARELLVGVNNMQIEYGIGSNESTTSFVSDASTVSDWSQVRSINLSLTVRSTRTNISSSHSYLEKTFSETIVARNRTL